MHWLLRIGWRCCHWYYWMMPSHLETSRQQPHYCIDSDLHSLRALRPSSAPTYLRCPRFAPHQDDSDKLKIVSNNRILDFDWVILRSLRRNSNPFPETDPECGLSQGNCHCLVRPGSTILTLCLIVVGSFTVEILYHTHSNLDQVDLWENASGTLEVGQRCAPACLPQRGREWLPRTFHRYFDNSIRDTDLMWHLHLWHSFQYHWNKVFGHQVIKFIHHFTSLSYQLSTVHLSLPDRDQNLSSNSTRSACPETCLSDLRSGTQDCQKTQCSQNCYTIVNSMSLGSLCLRLSRNSSLWLVHRRNTIEDIGGWFRILNSIDSYHKLPSGTLARSFHFQIENCWLLRYFIRHGIHARLAFN